MSIINVLEEKCTGCSLCVDVCPVNAITIIDGKATISNECTLCGVCIDVCPQHALVKPGISDDLDHIDVKHLSGCKDIWIVAEVRQEVLADSTLELLGEATRLVKNTNHKVGAILLCDDPKEFPQQLIQYGADKVYLVKHEELGHFRDEPYAHVISELVKEYKPLAMLFGATAFGRSLAPKLAARLHTGLSADCTTLELRENGILIQTRPAFGGNLFASIICPNTYPQIATVRPKVMSALEPDNMRDGIVIEKQYDLKNLRIRTTLLEFIEQVNPIGVDGADIVVAAGHGVGNQKGLALVKELADAYGGALGATRKLVDLGWMPYENQIGQTGKTVGPKLYIACGISGAVQHFVGISASKNIIAINSDPDAGIFRVADYGIVGDLNEIIPLLIAEKDMIRGKFPK